MTHPPATKAALGIGAALLGGLHLGPLEHVSAGGEPKPLTDPTQQSHSLASDCVASVATWRVAHVVSATSVTPVGLHVVPAVFPVSALRHRSSRGPGGVGALVRARPERRRSIAGAGCSVHRSLRSMRPRPARASAHSQHRGFPPRLQMRALTTAGRGQPPLEQRTAGGAVGGRGVVHLLGMYEQYTTVGSCQPRNVHRRYMPARCCGEPVGFATLAEPHDGIDSHVQRCVSSPQSRCTDVTTIPKRGLHSGKSRGRCPSPSLPA